MQFAQDVADVRFDGFSADKQFFGDFGVGENKFNEYGEDGWELITADFEIVNGHSSARRYIFKRQR